MVVVSERLRQIGAELPGSTVRLGGDVVLESDIGDAVQDDLLTAELRSLPIIAIILVFVFGGLLAAGIPLLATLASTAGAFALLFGFAQVVQLDSNVVTVVTLLSLGLSIDYALLLVARYREELVPAYQRALAAGERRIDRIDLAAWAARWRTDPAVLRVEPARLAGPGLATVVLAVRGDAQGDDAQDLVRRIRADRPPGAESWVTGSAAVLLDMLRTLRGSLPWAVLVTLVAMMTLLFLMTGSIVVPLKAIAMAVVSLGATFGVLVGVFQHGWLAGPLDTQTVGGLSPFVIGLVFAFAFGLSMDYEVFLLGRVKEYVDGGHDTETAVRRGLQHTGRIITSAALLMLVVFGCFGAARMGDIEEVGIGLFVAVLVDATVVRCLLVPATMSLLGRWNWWAPGPLRRLHQRFESSSATAACSASSPTRVTRR